MNQFSRLDQLRKEVDDIRRHIVENAATLAEKSVSISNVLTKNDALDLGNEKLTYDLDSARTLINHLSSQCKISSGSETAGSCRCLAVEDSTDEEDSNDTEEIEEEHVCFPLRRVLGASVGV